MCIIFIQDVFKLESDFSHYYTRNIYIRIRDCWNRPIASAPGAYMDVLDRYSDDYNWTFKWVLQYSVYLIIVKLLGLDQYLLKQVVIKMYKNCRSETKAVVVKHVPYFQLFYIYRTFYCHTMDYELSINNPLIGVCCAWCCSSSLKYIKCSPRKQSASKWSEYIDRSNKVPIFMHL